MCVHTSRHVSCMRNQYSLFRHLDLQPQNWHLTRTSPPQSCALPEVSGLYVITSKRKVCVHAGEQPMNSYTLHRCTCNHTRRHRHTQINLSSHCWILFLMLLTSISPVTCTGACTRIRVPGLVFTLTLIRSLKP